MSQSNRIGLVLLAIAIGVGGFFVLTSHRLVQPRPPTVQEYYTKPGEPADIFIMDRAIVLHLNGGTRITLLLTPRSVETVLGHGEVTAEIRSDDPVRFRLVVDRLVLDDVGTVVTALGLKNKVQFSVTQGSARLFERGTGGELLDPEVALSSTAYRRKEVTVRAGELADLARNENGAWVVTRTKRDIAEVLRRAQWRKGLWSFAGEPLDQICEIFNMYSHYRIVVDDPKLAQFNLGGAYDVAQLDEFLSSLRALSIDTVREPGAVGDYDGTIHIRAGVGKGRHASRRG